MEIKSKIVKEINKYTNIERLNKICNQRGIDKDMDMFSRFAHIGYVEGYNTAMGELQDKGKIKVVSQTEIKEEETHVVKIEDDLIKITDNQLKLLEWLEDNYLIHFDFVSGDIEDLT